MQTYITLILIKFYSVPHPKTINSAIADVCKYIDLLCRQEDLTELFKEKIQLFPPDIEKEFGIGSSESKRLRNEKLWQLKYMYIYILIVISYWYLLFYTCTINRSIEPSCLQNVLICCKFFNTLQQFCFVCDVMRLSLAVFTIMTIDVCVKFVSINLFCSLQTTSYLPTMPFIFCAFLIDTLFILYNRSQIPDVSYLASLAVQIEAELKKQNKVFERLQSEVRQFKRLPFLVYLFICLFIYQIFNVVFTSA